jgi:hypothetical protein
MESPSGRRYDGGVEVPDESLPLIIESLEHRAAYLRSARRDERPILELAEKLKRRPPASDRADKRAARESG